MENEEICLCGTFNHRCYRFVAGKCSVWLDRCSIHMHNHIGILLKLFVQNRYAGTRHPIIPLCARQRWRIDSINAMKTIWISYASHTQRITWPKANTLLRHNTHRFAWLCLALSTRFTHLLLWCYFDVTFVSSIGHRSNSLVCVWIYIGAHRMSDNVITHYLCSKSNQAPQPFHNERVNGIVDRK